MGKKNEGRVIGVIMAKTGVIMGFSCQSKRSFVLAQVTVITITMKAYTENQW